MLASAPNQVHGKALLKFAGDERRWTGMLMGSLDGASPRELCVSVVPQSEAFGHDLQSGEPLPHEFMPGRRIVGAGEITAEACD